MDRLVTVDVKELEINFRPSVRCSAAFHVTNLMHTMSVAVHLTTTRPGLFSIKPATISLLPPLSTASFSLSLAPSDRPPAFSSSDAVAVRSALFPTAKHDAAALHRLFSVPGVRVFRDAAIPIALVGPHVVDLLLLSAETLESAFLLSKAVASCSIADLSTLLRRAAAAGNPRFVSAFIAAGADVNSRGSDCRSALSLAVSSGNNESVAVLVNAGAKLDLAIDRAFHDAAAANRTDLIDLLARSAPRTWADAVDCGGRTPVHYAAANGHLEAVRLCIESGGGDPDRADAIGWTPLHCAASGGVSEVVEFLIERSAFDPKIAVTCDGKKKKTPFDLAVDGGHSHLYDALRLGDNLLRAASAGDLAGVKGCLSRGVKVGRRDQNEWTALHRAAFDGRVEVVEALIDGGAALDAVDDVGFSPLRLAVEMGHAEVAMALVRRGARAGSKGIQGKHSSLALQLDSCCVNTNSASKDRSIRVVRNKVIQT